MTDQQTILVVEDAPVNRKILSELLLRQGYAILTADSGEAALAKVAETRPDLIILDILMPGIDGYITCKKLKSNSKTSDIPVIFISSLDATADKLGGFEAGGVDYITKPFQPAEVLVRISTHLRLCQLQRRLEEQNRQLEREKQRSEALLRNVLPERTARELLATGTCKPQLFSEATVCFADIVSFTATASRLSPKIIIHELNEIFTAFDRIALGRHCERMKTIGDAYLFVCGVPEPDPEHAQNVAQAALEMLDFLKKRNQEAEHCWQIRIGMHSGPLVGGIVGTEKYLYDIFGDTVNIAARMEELSQPMQVNVSSATQSLLKNAFTLGEGKEVEMKGKGKQLMYTLRNRLQGKNV